MQHFDFTQIVTPEEVARAALPKSDITVYEIDGVVHITVGGES